MLIREKEHSFLSPLSGVVLDVGAYGLEFSEAALSHGASRVIAVDIDGMSDQPGITGINAVVWKSNGVIEVSRCEKRTAWHVGGNGLSLSRCMTIDQLMSEYGIDQFDLIKLDCERSELEILPAIAGVPARQISIEFHLHLWPEDEPRIDVAIESLSDRYDIVQHEKTQRKMGEPANYWDTLLVHKCS